MPCECSLELLTVITGRGIEKITIFDTTVTKLHLLCDSHFIILLVQSSKP